MMLKHDITKKLENSHGNVSMKWFEFGFKTAYNYKAFQFHVDIAGSLVWYLHCIFGRTSTWHFVEIDLDFKQKNNRIFYE